MAQIAECLESRNYALTVGRVYQVIEIEGNRIVIANNSGRVNRYSPSLFRITDDEVSTTMNQERPVPRQEVPRPEPVPEPINVRTLKTENEVITQIESGDSTITIAVNSINADETVGMPESALTTDGSQISCGVCQIYNLNTTISNIQDFIEDNFEDDFINACKIILKRNVQHAKGSHAFGMLSTTNNLPEWAEQALNEMAVTYTPEAVRNNNSGNDILVWIV